MNKHYNEFTKPFSRLGRRYDLAKVFNDLLTISICSFHQINIKSRLQIKDQENEALYLETIKSYKNEDLDHFAHALGALQLNVLDHPYSDILGEFFMNEITKGQNGQYFTPENICDFMAKINQPIFENQKADRVLDPACGSGRMLLSYAKQDHKNYFFGADNSNTCAKMATLNFFLNGLKGEVSWMNSLSMEWYGGWHINMNGLGIVPISKEQSLIWTKAPKIESKKQTQQLTLF